MNNKFIKVFLGMSSLLILGKILGFARTALVASTYGAGFITDIYSFEDSIINEIYAIFSTFLACSFIPRYLSLDGNGRNRLYNLLLNWGITIMLFLTVICLIFTRPLLHILTPGFFELYDIKQIIFVTRINLIMLILTFLVNYIMIVLQAHDIFIYLTMESVILNMIVILYLIILPDGGIIGLILCRIAAYALLLLLVFVKLKKETTLKYYFCITLKDKDLTDMIKLSLPMLFITVLWQLNYVIDKSMASGLASGSIACLNYANMISMLIYNVIGYIVSTYAYPAMGRIQADHVKLQSTFKEYLTFLLHLVLPISIMTMFFAGYISDFIYGHGNMSEESITNISRILVMYLPGSTAYCIKNFYSKLFYIKQNTKIVLVLDVAGCLVNIVLNLILVKIIGVYGLALATSISCWVTVILQMLYANKKKYTEFKIKTLKNSILSALALTIMGYAAYQAMNYFFNNEIIKFVYVVAVYLITFALHNLKDLKKIMSREK